MSPPGSSPPTSALRTLSFYFYFYTISLQNMTTSHIRPVLANQAVVMGEPAPVLGEPAPILGEHAPVLANQAVLMGEPAPFLGEPAPVVDHRPSTSSHQLQRRLGPWGSCTQDSPLPSHDAVADVPHVDPDHVEHVDRASPPPFWASPPPSRPTRPPHGLPTLLSRRSPRGPWPRRRRVDPPAQRHLGPWGS